ncbi:MAG: helix-turn-helix domain-containing protein [Proteobacteria bacterium]|jgi:hypothetical protein|nr:helix-turn-helix domain-containing protein [Pseudomonadota bacterium]
MKHVSKPHALPVAGQKHASLPILSPRSSGGFVERSQGKISAEDQKFLNFFKRLQREGRISSRIRVTYLSMSARPKQAFKHDDFLTAAEAGAFLSLSPKTLANWRTQGGGPRFSKVGAAVRYRFADLLSFITSRSGKSTAEIQRSQPANSNLAG